MITRELKVINDTGIHARPASVIVEQANKFTADIFFTKDGVRANAKSIMNLLFLAAEPGSTLIAEAEGPDEELALEAMTKLFNARFSHEGL